MTPWTELYDPKKGRRLREIPYYGGSKVCKGARGHALDCPEITLESMASVIQRSQVAEEHTRTRADRYWNMVKEYQGKVAILKHENNTLRKANEQLRRTLSDTKNT